MLEQGEQGFEGGMSARKYMVIAKVSKPTATRDLRDLLEKNILLSTGSGRGTNYQVNLASF
jgi:Fic family protein